MPKARIQPDGTIKPQVVREADGTYTVKSVPIFMVHKDRGYDANASYMRGVVDVFKDNRRKGYRPRITVGHTPDDESPDQSELPNVGFLDNMDFEDDTGWVYADYTGLQPDTFQELKQNKFPGRSVEIFADDKFLSGVALLGGTPPHQKLPDIKFKQQGGKLCYAYSQSLNIEGSAMPKRKDTKTDTSTVTIDADAITGDDDAKRYGAIAEALTAMSGSLQEMAGRIEAMEPEADKNMDEDDPDKNEDGPMPPEDKDKDKDDAEKNKADGQPDKYAALEKRLSTLEQEKKKVEQEKATLADEVAAVKYDADHAKWVQRYSDLRVPRGKIDPDELADETMEQAPDKREKYFERMRNAYSGTAPATEPVDREAIAASRSDKYSAKMAFYRQHKDKYRGDMLRAFRDFEHQDTAKSNGKSD